MIIPIMETRLKVSPVKVKANKAPTNAIGKLNIIVKGCRSELNNAAINIYTKRMDNTKAKII